MTQEELGFYNKQDKEELVIMCIARDNKIEHLRKENDSLITVIDLVREYLYTHKLYSFKYDDEELFEVTTDKKAKDDLLAILERVNEE